MHVLNNYVAVINHKLHIGKIPDSQNSGIGKDSCAFVCGFLGHGKNAFVHVIFTAEITKLGFVLYLKPVEFRSYNAFVNVKEGNACYSAP